jgi:hypothetical protein
MKKLLARLVVIAAAATIVVVSAEAYAGWKMYDNFNSGVIDPNRWTMDTSSAIITVEGGRAKFEHLAGHPADSASLGIMTSTRGGGMKNREPLKAD